MSIAQEDPKKIKVKEIIYVVDMSEQDKAGLLSEPPSGCYKITRIWRNADGNLEYEYDDTPIP